jgi:hypothetical protein
MDYFIDSVNADEIIEKLHTLDEQKDINELRKYIDIILPKWLLYATDNYSKDYPHLRFNWEHICKMMKTEPQKIVLVQEIIFDNDHKVVKEVCEIITKYGYVVRRINEFTLCKNCLLAIPCKDVWHLLKEKKMPVPEVWSDKCSNC